MKNFLTFVFIVCVILGIVILPTGSPLGFVVYPLGFIIGIIRFSNDEWNS